MIAEHTPTPWRFSLNVGPTKAAIVDVDGYSIVDVSRNTRDSRFAANVATIVRAVNSHAALVEALQTLSNILADDLTDSTPEDSPEDFAALHKATAALKLARQ